MVFPSPARHAAARISSLLQKPDKSGTPAKAAAPHRKTQCVVFSTLRKPPKRLMSMTLPIACMTLPAARKSRALKKAWVKRWKIAANTAKDARSVPSPLPSARNM